MTEHNQQFDTFQEWVNKASSWLTRHPNYSEDKWKHFRAHCFDKLGRRCFIGADFQRAHDEDAFPVRWLWPDEIGQVALDLKDQKEAANGIYMKYLGIATILGDAMAHVADEDLEECAEQAFHDLARTCPNIKVVKQLRRYDLSVRPEEDTSDETA